MEVELEELDSPRSWLSDSVVELLPKLDRSELIELVLIPLLLLCASIGGAPDCYLIGKLGISLRERKKLHHRSRRIQVHLSAVFVIYVVDVLFAERQKVHDYDFTSTLWALESPIWVTSILSPIARSASGGISNNTSPVESSTTS